MNTIRVGAEVKVTPQFAVRAGVAYSDSPIKDKLKNGEKEVFTVGTIPNYTIDKGVMNGRYRLSLHPELLYGLGLCIPYA